MRSALVGLGLMTCTQAAPAPSPVVAPAPAVAPPVPIAAPPAPRVAEAPPGGDIELVAATPDDRAAVTVDSSNEVRLWPTLDGTRAPVVLDLPRPRAIALQRAGDGFALCALFDTGTLEVSLDALGRPTATHDVAAFDRVAAVDDGFAVARGRERHQLDLAGQLGPPSRSTPVASRITARHADLVIPGAAGGRYLGYAFLADTAPVGDPAHLVVPGAPGHWLQLTPALAPVRTLVPPVDGALSLRWLAGDDWLVDSPAGLSLWTPGQPAVLAYASTPPPAQQIDPRGLSVIDVEPETGLVLLSAPRLLRYVPARRTLEEVAFVWPPDTAPTLLAPSLAHGAVLALAAFLRDARGNQSGALQYVRDLAHPDAGATRWHDDKRWPIGVSRSGIAAINNYYGGGGWHAVDATGRDVAVPANVALSPDGRRYLAQGDARALSLVPIAAPPTWTVTLPGTDPAFDRTPLWLDERHALLVTRHGLATLDVATGALGSPIAGWQLELSPSPHPASTLGYPLLAATLPSQPLLLAADREFQQLVTQVAAASSSRITGWGPMHLDGRIVRAAWLQSHEDDGSPVLSVLLDGPAGITAILCSAWGFPMLQGPFPDAPPVWGVVWQLGAAGVDSGRTIEVDRLAFAVKWIHGSSESVSATFSHGRYLVARDAWTDRDNTGHGIHTTSGGLAPGHHPNLDGFIAKSMRFRVSSPTRDPAALAASLHPLPPPD